MRSRSPCAASVATPATRWCWPPTPGCTQPRPAWPSGPTPVFADVDPASLLLSAGQVARLVTPRTVAVVVTHLYGNVADVAQLRRRTAAGRAPSSRTARRPMAPRCDGRPAGSMGDVAAFSFYPTKNLGALGDAGAVVTSRRRGGRPGAGAAPVRVGVALSGHGGPAAATRASTSCRPRSCGSCWRRCTSATPAGRDHPPAVPRCLRRPASTSWPHRATGPCPVPTCASCGPPSASSWSTDLESAGVSCAVHYPVPDHQQPALAGHRFRHGDLAETERACRRGGEPPLLPRARAGRDRPGDRGHEDGRASAIGPDHTEATADEATEPARRVLSVVIPVYNNEASLPELLRSPGGAGLPARASTAGPSS